MPPEPLPWPYFAVISDLYKFKGVETAISALARCSDQDVRLLIIGRPIEPDYANVLTRLVEGLNLTSRVVFSDFLPHSEVLYRLRHAEACLLTSRFENHSRIPTEAMAVRCPVIAADTPSAREACGAAAVYYPPGDGDLLSGLMSQVRFHGSQRRELVDAGCDRVASLEGVSGPAILVQHLEELAQRGKV
jgi:glycosyltransferase involved in cell wall biosynthesis